MGKKDTTSFAMSTRVLFVCMGNICRSPMAEGVFRQLVRQAGLDEVVSMESAGTHSFHAGESADKRAIASAQKRGVDISAHRARAGARLHRRCLRRAPRCGAASRNPGSSRLAIAATA